MQPLWLHSFLGGVHWCISARKNTPYLTTWYLFVHIFVSWCAKSIQAFYCCSIWSNCALYGGMVHLYFYSMRWFTFHLCVPYVIVFPNVTASAGCSAAEFSGEMHWWVCEGQPLLKLGIASPLSHSYSCSSPFPLDSHHPVVLYLILITLAYLSNHPFYVF